MFKKCAQKVLTVFGHSDKMRPHTERNNTSHMRTKTLLLTAALSAAGLATSMAQVYSVNAVGYVNKSIPANGWAALGNPLNGPTNNSLNNILPIPSGYTAVIYRFDPVQQAYLAQIDWIEGFGWFSADDPDPTINPGEGFFFQNTTAQALNLTFVGEVPSGTLHNPVTGNNRWTIRSSVVPKGLRLGDTDATTGTANTLEFPAAGGDAVYIFDTATQAYLAQYDYIGGFGWFSADDPDPDGPLIQPGSAFFLQAGSGTAARDWVQTFSVN